MKKSFLLIILLAGIQLSVLADGRLDSLKQRLQDTTLTDSAKAVIYTSMAQTYLDDQAPNRLAKSRNQENAVNYTMLALHLYSKRDDTTGLRVSYANLSKAYRAQGKYTQAKWFILQSGILAKGQKDIPNTIASLVELANIKMQTGDYITAKSDLNYALRLTSKYNVSTYQMDIIQALAVANNGIKNMPEDETATFTASNGTSTIVTETPQIIKVTKAKRTVKIIKGKTKAPKIYNANNKIAKPVIADRLASI